MNKWPLWSGRLLASDAAAKYRMRVSPGPMPGEMPLLRGPAKLRPVQRAPND